MATTLQSATLKQEVQAHQDKLITESAKTQLNSIYAYIRQRKTWASNLDKQVKDLEEIAKDIYKAVDANDLNVINTTLAAKISTVGAKSHLTA